tara:strand:+ start:9860 stop:10393 length:534 start_codon:yes stop_codon:yes gene_type:complete
MDKFDTMSRKELLELVTKCVCSSLNRKDLQELAKEGKLSEYNVNGKSSNVRIIEAVRQRDIDNETNSGLIARLRKFYRLQAEIDNYENLRSTTCDEIKILQKAHDWHREQAQQQEALAQECQAKLPALKAEAVTLRNELVKLKKEDELANKRDGLQPRTLSTTMLERRKSNRKSKKK